MIRCDDARLLMLAHGALGGRAALGTRLHAALCPSCRARMRRFVGLSASLAGAYRNPVLGVRTFARPGMRWASAALLAALLLGGGSLAASRKAQGAVPVAARACSPASHPTVAPSPNLCPLHRDP